MTKSSLFNMKTNNKNNNDDDDDDNNNNNNDDVAVGSKSKSESESLLPKDNKYNCTPSKNTTTLKQRSSPLLQKKDKMKRETKKKKNNNNSGSSNNNNNNNNIESNAKSKSKSSIINKERKRAVLHMTLAMSLHFAGHEFARSPIMSMFTSKEMGFQSSAILPLAVGFVSPFSIFLLWSYTKMLKKIGPRFALTKSTLIGSSFLLFIGCALFYIQHLMSNHQQHHHPLSKYLLFSAFVFQSANVQFLYTQHWSFIGSVLSPDEIATSGSLIAGIGSITSTIAAAYVSTLVQYIGLIGSECVAAFMIGFSSFFANKAYHISSVYCFEPHLDKSVHHGYNCNKKNNSTSKNGHDDDDDGSGGDDDDDENDSIYDKNGISTKLDEDDKDRKHAKKEEKQNHDENDKDHHNATTDTMTASENHNTQQTKYKTNKEDIENKSNSICSNAKDDNIVCTSVKLFKRVPIIGAMFIEVLIAQCLSSLLNFYFVSEVKNEILDNEERAGFTGKCYAYVNGVSGVLQFFILPFIVKRIGAKWLWLSMPLIMLILTSLQFYEQNPSLALVGLTFLTMKTIEYSLRGQASEMVWVMLDYESRFIGKELINLLANRLGKSTTAVCLFLLTIQLEKDSSYYNVRRFAVQASVILAFLWLICTVRVMQLIPTKRVHKN